MAGNKGEMAMFNDADFVERYKDAEGTTGTFGLLLVEASGLKASLSSATKLKVLDMACGTAVVTKHVMETVGPHAKDKVEVTCADSAANMIGAAKARIEANGWPATTAVTDAQDTKLPSSEFDYMFHSFGPNMLPEPQKALEEAVRMLKPGGTYGCTVWSVVPWMEDVREVWTQHPELPKFPMDDEFMSTFSKHPGEGGAWMHADKAKGFFEKAGFVDVNTTEETRNPELYAKSFIAMMPGMLGMVMQKFWSESERSEYKEKTEQYIKEHFKEKYGDRPFPWEWTALIVLGKKPQ